MKPLTDMIRTTPEARPFEPPLTSNETSSDDSPPPTTDTFPLRVTGRRLWEYFRLQIDADEKRVAFEAAVKRLEKYGEVMKQELGFSDGEILDPDGYVISRQEWQARLEAARQADRTRQPSSPPPDSVSPDRGGRTGELPGVPYG